MLSFFDFLNWEQASKDTIDFKKIYVDMAQGDLKAGLMLSEIVFWHLPNKEGRTKLRVWKDGRLWIACRRYEWWERTRMSPKEADHAITILCDREGICIKDLFKFDGEVTVHIRLNEDKFLERLEYVFKNPVSNPFLPKGKIENDQKEKSDLPIEENPITEVTTAVTTEKKDCTELATSSVQEKDDWRKKKLIVTPSASVASSNEQVAYSALELYLMKMLKRTSLTEAQRKTLAEKVVVRSTDGNTTEYSCPNELYDTDENFKKYVEKKVIETLNASNGKASTTSLLTAIANYTHAHGWLSYQSALHPVPPQTPEYSTPKAAALVKTKERKGVF